MTEKELLFQLRKGNQPAVTQWYRLYMPRLLRFVRSKIAHHRDSEEICQDIFLSCLENISVFKGDSSLFTWMCAVAKHEIADYFRKKYAKKVVQMVPFAEVFLPEHIMDMHLTSEIVRKVLKKLSPRERELLLLKYIDRQSVESIAQTLHMSFKATESALFRAKRSFRLLFVIEGV